MMIGLTGSFCAGKDTVAEYLVQSKGFVHCSLSDELRRELAARNIPESRESLIIIGTRLREAEGNAVLARRALAHCLPGKDYVITSIRHCDEVEELRKRKDFYLVNLDAPAALRFERMCHRGRRGDPTTFGKFLELEKQESQSKGSGQQLMECGKRADSTIVNAEDVDALYQKIDSLIFRLLSGR